MNKLSGALSSTGLEYEMILEGYSWVTLREHFENLGLPIPQPLRSHFADNSVECNSER